MRRLTSTVATLALTALIALTLHAALAAGGAVPGSRAGSGDRAVSGHAVTEVRWSLAPGDPGQAAGVRLRLDEPARVVRARVADGAWATCSVAGLEASCLLGAPVPLAAITTLEVATTS